MFQRLSFWRIIFEQHNHRYILHAWYFCLGQYIGNNKAADNDWFTVKPTDGTGERYATVTLDSGFNLQSHDVFICLRNTSTCSWAGKCWYYHDKLKYEFDFCFDIPVGYPSSAPAIKIPSLQGKTAKMYRGGAICLTIHFNPLWAKNAPKFGIAHAIALGVSSISPSYAIAYSAYSHALFSCNAFAPAAGTMDGSRNSWLSQ